MDEFRILATCVLGLGFSHKGFQAGLKHEPHLVACDSGSSDFGPYFLGSGQLQKPPSALERELASLLVGARSVGAAFITGSVGGAGADPHLAGISELFQRVGAENKLKFRMAEISASVEPAFLKRKLKTGDLQPLGPAPKITDEVLDRLAAAVGQMGVGPFIRALDMDAEVVIAGRTTDPAIFAGGPLRAGLPTALSWHAAKTIDKGYLATNSPKDGSPVLASIRKDHFTVTPTREGVACTPSTVAGMMVYENSHPSRVVQPEGTIDSAEAVYTQLQDGRTVHVTGSRFHPAKRITIKIEGAELIGHRAIVIAGIRDPRLIARLDDFFAEFRHTIARYAHTIGISPDEYTLQFRAYGRDGVMGELEPMRDSPSHEIGLIVDLVGKTPEVMQALAVRLAASGSRLGLVDGVVGGGNFAYPFSPSTMRLGPVYAWSVWHLAALDDGEEEQMFPITIREVGR